MVIQTLVQAQNWVSLLVQLRFELAYENPCEKHRMNEAVNFTGVFRKHVKLFKTFKKSCDTRQLCWNCYSL